jgi:hypothetical protein
MGPDERRKSKRIAAALGMEESVMVEVNGQQYLGSLVNLGVGGALLDMREATFEFRPDVLLTIYFENGGHMLPLQARMLRSDDRHVAFAFCDTTAADNEQIRAKIIRMSILISRLSASQAPHPFTRLMPFVSRHNVTSK